MTDLEERWYWDRRIDKAYYPVDTGDGTTTLLSVWHDEELGDALDRDALVTIAEFTEQRGTTPFDLKESFRLPDPITGHPADE